MRLPEPPFFRVIAEGREPPGQLLGLGFGHGLPLAAIIEALGLRVRRGKLDLSLDTLPGVQMVLTIDVSPPRTVQVSAKLRFVGTGSFSKLMGSSHIAVL